MIYTTGNEQDYHFKVLFKILSLLGYRWADKLNHLSYGMVDLPTGKMKSREGLVVDADELIQSMNKKAKSISESLGKINDLSASDQNKLFKQVSLAALKYHILKVDPKKSILFDPNESIDFNGNTGPFIQYTYARIQSILKRAKMLKIDFKGLNFDNVKKLSVNEKRIIDLILKHRNNLIKSAETYSPSILCNYVYDLSKTYNSFYQDEKIFDGKNNETTSFKIALSDMTSSVIRESLNTLGMDVVNKM